MKSWLHFAIACFCLALSAWFFLNARKGVNALTHNSEKSTRQTPQSRTIPETKTSTQTAAQGPSKETQLVSALLASAPKGPGDLPLVRPEKLFASFPEFRKAYAQAASAHQRLGYGQFFASAGLPDAQKEEMCGILTQREETWGKIRASIDDGPADASEATVQEQDQINIKETEAKLLALLGKDKYADLQNYRSTLEARDKLRVLAAASYYSDIPITLAQMNELATITTESGIFPGSDSAHRPDGEAFIRVSQQAGAILSREQMDVFELILDNRQVSFGIAGIIEDRNRAKSGGK